MTAVYRVLLALIATQSEGITFKNFGTGFRLAARIKDLRDGGHDIHTYMVHTFNSDGHPVQYARYVLVKKA